MSQREEEEIESSDSEEEDWWDDNFFFPETVSEGSDSKCGKSESYSARATSHFNF